MTSSKFILEGMWLCYKLCFGTYIVFYSDDIIALVLAKPDAIQEWRDTLGPTNPIRAKQEAPHTLRAKYGHDQTRNGLHGSDSYLSAEREIKFIFPEGKCELFYSTQLTT